MASQNANAVNITNGTAVLSYLLAGYNTASIPQGDALMWNLSGGSGESDFVTNRGQGSGGWKWLDEDPSTHARSIAASLDRVGNFNSIGTLTQAGVAVCLVNGTNCPPSPGAPTSGTPTVTSTGSLGSGGFVNFDGSGCAVAFHSTDYSGGICIHLGTGFSAFEPGQILQASFSHTWPGNPNCTIANAGGSGTSAISGELSTGTSTTGFALAALGEIPANAYYYLSYSCSY